MLTYLLTYLTYLLTYLTWKRSRSIYPFTDFTDVRHAEDIVQCLCRFDFFFILLLSCFNRVVFDYMTFASTEVIKGFETKTETTTQNILPNNNKQNHHNNKKNNNNTHTHTHTSGE